MSASIHINTDKEQYYAGEEISGHFILSPSEDLPVEAINVKLCGTEYTKIPDPKGKASATEKLEFIGGIFTTTVHNTFTTGAHTVPFKLSLAVNLPGTFYKEIEASTLVIGEIWYELRVEVKVSNALNTYIVAKKMIIILQALKTDISSPEIYKEAKVSYLCCIPKGQVSLSAAIDKNAYAPGELAMLSLIVDNTKSQVHLPSFYFTLEQRITIKSQGRTQYQNNTIVRQEVGGVASGERAERLMGFNLPEEAVPSTSGSLVKCKYELKVELQVPWSLNIKSKTPIQIFTSRPIEEFQEPELKSELDLKPLEELKSLKIDL